MTRTDIVSFVAGCASIPEDSIGRVGLSAKGSFVEVEASHADDIIKAVNSARFNGKKVKAGYAPQKERCKDKLAKNQ